MAECWHVTLKRKLTGGRAWYECEKCGQKFLPHKAEEPLAPWDGKVKILSDEVKNGGTA